MWSNQHPLSIYIHIPFCRQKCHYCDFLSWPNRLEDLDGYVEALLAEVDLYRGRLAERPVATVFFGGGTPSLLTGVHTSRILEKLAAVGNLTKNAEITMEANPEQLTLDQLKAYRQAGVNRLSLGLQSTHDPLLAFLGRRHTAADFYQVVELARQAGFVNVNADLIFGIPGQQLEQWQESLETLEAMKIPHLSCYGLTFEPGTPLHRQRETGVVCAANEDLEYAMFRWGIEWLQQKGYQHYEISNYALPGKSCHHNITYWENREYLGLGAGAHGFLSGERTANSQQMESYVTAINQGDFPYMNSEKIGLTESVSETMFLGLRMRRGISETAFESRYGQSMASFFEKEIAELVQRGLLERNSGFLRLTEKGIDLSNLVFEKLLVSSR
ncbi:radical SAM family heme chaperone HemW [Anoxynatronum buryatiense]|uniref:Heme chaperone HemW n=1 Tax=Anoxynatronum buryatiense TaxID=489973 RepID=A0AA45WSU8_9CLOT|nr:radical SAM family heme chaperone HemW [Anoxynatronum buryatiense]SMP39607.1 oxygen-independent coproporphyrinogen-3 oxidase [Anoxynatronum buryatiense]